MKKKRDWSKWRIAKGIEHRNNRIFFERFWRDLFSELSKQSLFLSRLQTPSVPFNGGNKLRIPFVLSE
jgi:hypothetical protein